MPREVAVTGEGELLALASVDMRQATAAARLLDTRPGPAPHAPRALETAIAVCYWRPFSEQNRTGVLKKKWRPPDADGREVHAYLKRLRNKTYAHTDPEGGRKVITSLGGGIGEQWTPIPRETLPLIIKTCEEQAVRFLNAAAEATAALE